MAKTKPWEKYPELDHVRDFAARKQLAVRRRHRAVRYFLFRLQNALAEGEDKSDLSRLPKGFASYWLKQKPLYMRTPVPGGAMEKTEVPANLKGKPVADIGGFQAFASRWDVDSSLGVYIRWSSIWAEWDATLRRVAPRLGE